MIDIDPNRFTLDDLEYLEDTFDAGFEDVFGQMEAGELRVKHLRALVYVLRRHDEPDLTPDDVGGMTFGELRAAFPAGDDEDAEAPPT